MAHRSHPAHRRSTRTQCAACGHRLPGRSLVEHVAPGDGMVYVVEEREAPERSRVLIITAHVGVHLLSLVGLFVLITTGQPDERVLMWQSTMFAGGLLSAGILGYYFTRRPERSEPAQAAAVPSVVGQVEPPRRPRSVAIIGSFRKFYPEVRRAAEVFTAAGLAVTAPAKSTIVNPAAEFVRFASDPPTTSDEELQALALARILTADLVFVVAPDGYIGRTTCYELGMVEARGVPIFYSHQVKDLPIRIPASAVRDAETLAAGLASGGQIALTG